MQYFFENTPKLDNNTVTSGLPIAKTQSPIVTGTSVLAVKYKDGVMMTADMLASYGSLARFRDVERLISVGDFTVLGASGDISDFQYTEHVLKNVIDKEYTYDDGHKLHPKHIFEFLARLMYSRRNKMNPLWNSLVVGGVKDNEPFLGYVDLLGTTYFSDSIATGYGSYIAQPLLRKALEGRENNPLTEEEATKLLDDCMRVLFYRDARSLNKIQRAIITDKGITITDPYELKTEWSFGADVRGYS